MLLTPRGVCSLCEDLTNPGADVDLAQWTDGSPYYGIQYKNISYLPANAFASIFKEGTLLVSKLYINMEMLSALLVLCAGNPPVTSGFPLQRTSNAGL